MHQVAAERLAHVYVLGLNGGTEQKSGAAREALTRAAPGTCRRHQTGKTASRARTSARRRAPCHSHAHPGYGHAP